MSRVCKTKFNTAIRKVALLNSNKTNTRLKKKRKRRERPTSYLLPYLRLLRLPTQVRLKKLHLTSKSTCTWTPEMEPTKCQTRLLHACISLMRLKMRSMAGDGSVPTRENNANIDISCLKATCCSPKRKEMPRKSRKNLKMLRTKRWKRRSKKNAQLSSLMDSLQSQKKVSLHGKNEGRNKSRRSWKKP